ncbi:hypothetical protein BKA64DRAFT_770556 [Cadophora sp. MPI-SDFR-AT-0126]|nr:hypothetical protein BKA64DRAFT_770556 [Leotiomycetes sp. MPI-SDFR-AT-0126]
MAHSSEPFFLAHHAHLQTFFLTKYQLGSNITIASQGCKIQAKARGTFKIANMQLTYPLLLLAGISLSAAQQRSSSSIARSRARSLAISSRSSTAAESLSPALSTLPPNVTSKISIPPSLPANTVLPRVQDAYPSGFMAGRQNIRRKAKTRPTSIPSSVPADPILPREEEEGKELGVRGDDGGLLFVRQATTSATAPKKTKGAKAGAGAGGRNGNGNGSGVNRNGTTNAAPKSKSRKSKAAKATATPVVDARDLEYDDPEILYIRQATASSKKAKATKAANGAGCSGGARGNGTANAVPKSKGPKSKAAQTTVIANLQSAQAVPIPTDAPTIAFPTDGGKLPLIPTPKSKKTGSGTLTSSSMSSVVPTTLARRARDGGVEMTGWI